MPLQDDDDDVQLVTRSAPPQKRPRHAASRDGAIQVTPHPASFKLLPARSLAAQQALTKLVLSPRWTPTPLRR